MFEERFFAPGHFLEENLELQLLHLFGIRPMREGCRVHLFRENLGSHGHFAQHHWLLLTLTLLASMLRLGSIEPVVLLGSAPSRGPLNLCLAPPSISVKFPVRDELFERTVSDRSACCVVNFDAILRVRQRCVPDIIWGQAFYVKSSRALMSIQDVHVLHGPSKALLFCLSLPLELKQRHIVVKEPDIRKVGSIEERNDVDEAL
mmetsp:Transcript_43142/g.100715  ORF Transcript_43142/g.100715 Transcript_43142/m.100715 type:complete len:204 (+) Transcript_43142:729-1340(+)